MSYSGRCACGAVTLTMAGAPVTTRQCWCRDCQRLAAGGPTQNAIFPTEAVTITGELAHGQWTAESGNTLTFHFCPACGTQIYAQSSARPQFRTVRFGAIDQPHDLAPTMAIWTDRAPAWAHIDPALERYPLAPPAPPSAPAAED